MAGIPLNLGFCAKMLFFSAMEVYLVAFIGVMSGVVGASTVDIKNYVF